MDNSLRLLFILNIADIFLTKRLLSLGAIELNPIVSFLISIDFFLALIFKVIVTLAFIKLAVIMRDRISNVRSLIIGTDVVLGVLVAYQLLGILVLS